MRLVCDFGMQDKVAFWVLVVTGVNQGLLSFSSGFNTGMLASQFGNLFYYALGAAYLYFAFYSWGRWKANSESVVDVAPAPMVTKSEDNTDDRSEE